MQWRIWSVPAGAVVLALAGCPKADGEPGSASGGGVDIDDDPPQDTDGPGTNTTGSPSDTADRPDEPYDPEETHVVLLEDCGLELACEPIEVILEAWPPSAVECVDALHADGETGLVTSYATADGDSYDPYEQYAYVLLADRRLIRQTRGRICLEPPCESPPWDAWGGHEVCDVPGPINFEYYLPNCEPVPDFSCDEILDLMAQPPEPTAPCEERLTSDECDHVLSSQASCIWTPGAVYGADACTELAGPGLCRVDAYVNEACVLPPLCAGVDGEAVIFKTLDDGNVEVREVYGCWIEEGFERCEWGPPAPDGSPGALVYGPEACNCACG